MTAPKPRVSLPEWPRLMSRETAAAYCGISPGFFEATCPVVPMRIGSRKLWDRRLIDQWIDQHSPDAGKGPAKWLEMLDGDKSARR